MVAKMATGTKCVTLIILILLSRARFNLAEDSATENVDTGETIKTLTESYDEFATTNDEQQTTTATTTAATTAAATAAASVTTTLPPTTQELDTNPSLSVSSVSSSVSSSSSWDEPMIKVGHW